MKKCPKCDSEHKKNGVFCSRKCANSRNFSEESKLKKSLALIGKPQPPLTEEQKIVKIQKLVEFRKNKYENSSFDELGSENRKRRVLEEQNYLCNRCGIKDWLGEKLTLELEHKDGNNKNNVRENLECLCPNCHSLTKTWRGRNISKNKNKVSDEMLIECLNKTKSISQALLMAGLANKGGNYKRMKALKENG